MVPALQLLDLDTDVLLAIFSQLDAISLATVCCICRRLKLVASSAELWQPLAQRRWNHLHLHLFPAQPSTDAQEHITAASGEGIISIADESDAGSAVALSPVGAAGTDWRALFAGSNGWRQPRLGQRRLPLASHECEFVSALAVSPAASCGFRAPRQGPSGGDTLLLASSHNLEAWDAGAPGVELVAVAIAQFMSWMPYDTFSMRAPP